MTILQLQRSVMVRMEEVAETFWRLETKTSTRRPQVVGGWLPPKSGPESEDFPFILVRPRSGKDDEQEAAATVDIVVGTYSDTDDGYQDVLLLVEAIRQSLGAQPVLVESVRREGDLPIAYFECVRPLTWELQEEQPRPQWFGKVTTIWTVPCPQRVEARNPVEEWP